MLCDVGFNKLETKRYQASRLNLSSILDMQIDGIMHPITLWKFYITNSLSPILYYR